MELKSNVKSLVLSLSQYFSRKAENTFAQLLRHVEVLLAVIKPHEVDTVFNMKNSLGSDCLSALLQLVSNHNDDDHLMSKIFQLLLIITHNCSTEMVYQDLNIVSSLSVFLIKHLPLEENDTNLRCLELLEYVTYGRKVSHATTGTLDKLLSLILDQTSKVNGIYSSLSLGILSNLVQNNVAVQAQIKGRMGLDDMRKLIKYLKCDSMKDKISCLSVITFCCWEDDIARKFYNMKNMTQTLKLLFSRLSTCDDLLTQHRAADLCSELLKHDEVTKQIVVFETEQNCAVRLLLLLQGNFPECASLKIFEVLLAMCHVEEIRSRVCKRILECDKPREVLLKFVSQPVTKPHYKQSLMALDFIEELCDELADSPHDLQSCSWLPSLISVITQELALLIADDLPEDGEQKKPNLHTKILKLLKILNCLSVRDEVETLAASQLSVLSISQILEHQISYNTGALSSASQTKWSATCVKVILHALQLALKLKRLVPDLEKCLYSTLQDTRIVPFLASAITSSDKSSIQIALRLHQEALPLPDFPALLLSERIARLNRNHSGKQYLTPLDDNASYFCGNCFESPALRTLRVSDQSKLNSSSPCRPSRTGGVNDKENAGSVVSNAGLISDNALPEALSSAKSSELVEIYEHKIASLATKENHLQDLLEAKTLALSQADRLITQYRVQRAHFEEDTQKIANLLKKSESQSEALMNQVRAAESDRASMERELQAVVEENRNLQHVADQYDQLQTAYQDKTRKMDVLERNLATSRQEYDTLKELHDMIQKHNEKLKQQHSESIARLEEVEEDRVGLLKRISELEISVSDLTQLVEEQDKSYHKLMQEKTECDATVKALKAHIAKLEEDVKELKIKVSSVEHSKQQAEHLVKERNTEIKQLSQKVEGHANKIKELEFDRGKLQEAKLESEQEVNALRQKLDRQAQTLQMITELSNNIRGSQ